MTSRVPARLLRVAATVIAVAAATVPSLGAVAAAAPGNTGTPGSPAADPAGSCPPSATAVSYSDALDKAVVDGVTVGGLSDLAWDARADSWVSTVDNHGTDPARLWYLGPDLAHPAITRDPLVLENAAGVPYTGTTADDEGLAVLPDGRYLVSSETEPSIRIYGRDGVQQGALPVPARFAVTGTTAAGEATSNATLEGLTITPSGDTVIAAMEGALSGDVSPGGDARFHRFLVYRADGAGGYTLAKQISYRAGAGMRIAEVAAYGENSFLVEEAAYVPATGNSVELYAVHGLARAADVSAVPNLSAATNLPVRRVLVADIVQCPTLGATAEQPQANPLLDNYEGMAITSRDPAAHHYGVSLISDDNFGATQITRVLNLTARLP